MHSDKIKLRRFALQLYFAGDAKRYNEMRYPLAEKYDVCAQMDQFGEKVEELVDNNPFPRPKWYADKMFSYTMLYAKENASISVWIGCFFDKVFFVGFTGINYAINDSKRQK